LRAAACSLPWTLSSPPHCPPRRPHDPALAAYDFEVTTIRQQLRNNAVALISLN